jgi:hypothetical protein
MNYTFRERIQRVKEAFKFGLRCFYEEPAPFVEIDGHVTFDLRDSRTGEQVAFWERDNIVTLDAGILMARLIRDNTEPNFGLNMLAVGTGATGNVLAPDAPDNKQRKLNAEIARKAFSSTTFRDDSGAAVSIPTHILDLTTTFGESEAVGPLTEMALLSTISSNPATTNPNPDSFPNRDVTRDLTQYDTIANYLTFGAISKPATSILTITWRLTF